MIRILIMLGIILALLLPACSRDRSPVEPGEQIPPVVEPTPTQLVIDNCHAVQAAAVMFALENDNEFPGDLDQKNLAGHTLVDLLPDTAFLENPFTGMRSEPVDYTAFRPGQTAYRPLSIYDETRGRRFAFGYVITGFADSMRCCLLSNMPPSYYEREEQAIENCFTVMRAAEAFAGENNGLYPHTVSAEQTPNGHTLVDFLPGGKLLENPYYHCRIEPVDGAAAMPGQTGYVVCIGGEGLPTGYVITGSGDTYEYVVQIVQGCE